jgi:hypothetical protein
MTPEDFVRRIGEVAEQIGDNAGVGAMEIAGMIVSVLYQRPELADRFMREGVEMMISGDILPENGRLTFHRQSDGKVTTPHDLRNAIMVKNMELGHAAERSRLTGEQSP